MALNRIYCATGLIGGTEGDLDTIDGADLANKDMAIVITGGTTYFYMMDVSGAAAESSPTVIVPDDNNDAGNKNWELQSIYVNDITIADDIILATDDVKIGDFLEVVGSAQFGDADGTGADVTFYSGTAGDHMVFAKAAKTFTLTDINLVAGTADIAALGGGTPGSIVGSTIDAGTDFTVGNTVITDGVITDATGFQITGGTITLSGSAETLAIFTDDGSSALYHNNIKTFETNASGIDIGDGTDSCPFTYANGTDTLTLTCAIVDIDGASKATTYDADTDFTVGNTVITDGALDDNGVFTFDITTHIVFDTPAIYVGIDGTTPAYLGLLADAASDGGTLDIYTAQDSDTNGEYFRFKAVGEALQIGPSNDTDLLTINGGVTPTFSINAGWDAAGVTCSDLGTITTVNIDGGTIDATIIGGGTAAAITGTTIDATTDFTIGSTVITDGVITDGTGIQLAGNVDITGTLGIGGKLTAGANEIEGSSFDINGGAVDGATIGAAAACTFTSLTSANVGQISWGDGIPNANSECSGETEEVDVDQNTVGVTGVLVLSSDGSYDDADKDAEATVGRLVMAVDSGTGTKTVMSRGYATNTGWAFTPGQQLFVGDSGAITSTVPSASGDFIQVVGYATASTTVYFNPSPDYMEIA